MTPKHSASSSLDTLSRRAQQLNYNSRLSPLSDDELRDMREGESLRGEVLTVAFLSALLLTLCGLPFVNVDGVVGVVWALPFAITVVSAVWYGVVSKRLRVIDMEDTRRTKFFFSQIRRRSF